MSKISCPYQLFLIFSTFFSEIITSSLEIGTLNANYCCFQYFYVIFRSFQDEVMEAAAKYIETLQNNLVGQIRTHGYPDKLKSFSNRSDDFDSIRRAVDNYACAKMK